MSGLGDKVKGKGNEIKGDAKQGIGQETDDPNLAAEGAMDEAKGTGQGVVGAIRETVDDLAGTVKKD